MSKITVYREEPPGIETESVKDIDWEELKAIYDQDDVIGFTLTKHVPA